VTNPYKPNGYEPNGVITIADNLRLRAEVDQLRVEIGDLKQRLGLAEVLRNQLRKQRDHHRRELSVRAGYLTPEEYAVKMGWKCFGKGEKRNA
jgi:hypothetical protein